MADGSRSSSLRTPPVTSFPAWLRWALPSAADLIFLALLGALVFTPLSVKLLADAGIGWHIRNGQQILATHAIPRFDSFSFILWQPWFAWEWLYDIAVGKLEAWCGLNGVVWLTAVVIATVFAGTFRLAVARGTNLFVALVLVLLAMSASTIHFLARPHVLSWLFTLAWFWILDSTDRNGLQSHRARWLWALPLSMLLWVNVHGGFLLGFVMLGIYWLASLWTWMTTQETRLEDSLQKIAAGQRVRQLTGVGPALDRSQLRQSIWMEAARAHLLLSLQPFPDGSHRRVPVAQFPRHRAEMLSRATADRYRGSGGSWPQAETERASAGFVRGVRGTVCLAKYSRLFRFAGSDRRAIVAFAQCLGLCTKNERRRFTPARSPLASLRDRCGSSDRCQRRTCRAQPSGWTRTSMPSECRSRP